MKVVLGRSEKELFWAKMKYIFQFWDKMLPPLPLKHFMHPSCQVLGTAPGQLLAKEEGEEEEQWIQKPFLGQDGLEEIF